MTLSIGSRGSSVRDLQQQLRSAGFNPGSVDGSFGQRTSAAVRDFQRARGLEVDGKVGTQTMMALQRDGFDTAPAARTQPAARGASGGNLTATIDSTRGAGSRTQMVSGRVTVNGNTYDFRSGGHGRGSLPRGNYEITPHLWSRSDRSMNVGGVGYSFAMSDKFDSRVGATRRLLRIHPDGGSAGTEGCMGIVGNASVQRRFREDMRAELARHGGSFTLRVG